MDPKLSIVNHSSSSSTTPRADQSPTVPRASEVYVAHRRASQEAIKGLEQRSSKLSVSLLNTNFVRRRSSENALSASQQQRFQTHRNNSLGNDRKSDIMPIDQPWTPGKDPVTNSFVSYFPSRSGSVNSVASSTFSGTSYNSSVKETNTIIRQIDPSTGNKMINHYTILRELGRGVHGKVKLCFDTETMEHYVCIYSSQDL